MSDFSMGYSNNNYYNFNQSNQPIAEMPLNAVEQQFGEKAAQEPKHAEKRPSPYVAEANNFIKNGCQGQLSEKALSAYCMALTFKMVYGKFENANIQEVLNKDPILNANLSATEAKNATIDQFKKAITQYVPIAREKIGERENPSQAFKFNKASLTARVCGSKLHISVRNKAEQISSQIENVKKNRYVLVKTDPNSEQFLDACQTIKNAKGVYSGRYQCWMIPENTFKTIDPKIFDDQSVRMFASFNDFYTKRNGKAGSIPLTKDLLMQMVGENGKTLTQLDQQIAQMRDNAIVHLGEAVEQKTTQQVTQSHTGYKR